MQKNSIELVLYVAITSLFVLMLVIAAVLLFRIYLKRKNTLLREKEKMSIQFEQTLLNSKLEIQEQTFTHIAQEIHDNIGQVLSLVRLNLNTLGPVMDEQKINLMDQLMEKAISDLRHLSHSLDANVILQSGWINAVKKLLTAIQKTNTCKVWITIDEELPSIGKEKSIILYRMMQEIINNIVKHAEASEIAFTAGKKNGSVVVVIVDNGKGFDKKSVTKGAGLQNLESRARMINAALIITSEPGNGTDITISIKV
jgi:signal transduction histidine kinase